MSYTVGSLFTGIGGIDLAFVAAGFDIAFQVEIDDYCRKVLEKHERTYWPNAKRFTDIRTVTGNDLPAVTVLVGGFPCQDVSLAGKRAGLNESTRSGLWSEFARLIGDLRPRIVLLENVPGILTLGGSQVIADLAALGYVGQWGIVSAADAGAPHRRERWFCVAYRSQLRRNTGRAEQPLQGIGSSSETSLAYSENAGDGNMAHRTGNRQQIANQKRRRVGHDVTCRNKALGNTQSSGRRRVTRRRSGSQLANRHARHGWAAQRRLGGDAHGLSAGLDEHQWPARPGEHQHAWEPPRTVSGQPHRAQRLKALGNAVVPQVVYPIALSIREWLETLHDPEALATS